MIDFSFVNGDVISGDFFIGGATKELILLVRETLVECAQHALDEDDIDKTAKILRHVLEIDNELAKIEKEGKNNE